MTTSTKPSSEKTDVSVQSLPFLKEPCFSLKFKNGLKQFPAQGHEAQWLSSFKCLHGQTARGKYLLYMIPCILWLCLEVGRDKQGEEKRKKNTKKQGLWSWWGIMDDWAQMKNITIPSVICDVLPCLNNIKLLNEPKQRRKTTQTLRHPSLVYIEILKLWDKSFGYILSYFHFAPFEGQRGLWLVL